MTENSTVIAAYKALYDAAIVGQNFSANLGAIVAVIQGEVFSNLETGGIGDYAVDKDYLDSTASEELEESSEWFNVLFHN